ncbi:MAG: PAS domain S-box protein [Gemmatimonadales bacterium]|nr:MAG: PAS domain S-box protein [Gemmatimonadales bacterium]
MDRPRTRPKPPRRGSARPPVRLRRLPHDRRIVVLALATGLPAVVLALALLWFGDVSLGVRWAATVVVVILWLMSSLALRDRVVRPLQTLANMLAALREGDFSIRARLPEEGMDDALSLAYREVNALEAILREQRLGAVEATEFLRKVLESVDVALFAFDEDEVLALVNRAGERLLGQPSDRLLGRTAAELRLDDGLRGVAPRTLELSYPGGQGRWELRRSVIRQEGMPLRLLVLSDLSRALREEERQAWKRIIRVLSHEINNSLAPIKSISASLQDLMSREPPPEDLEEDVGRGLEVIQGRAEALGRFMGAYARLARLPEPERSPVRVGELARRVASLEVRLPVEICPGPRLEVQADPDQLEQLLINLIRNAVDATLEAEAREATVEVAWESDPPVWRLRVRDRGGGIPETGNLFVPFYTTKPGGSGIGLALSRQIAESHGGNLMLRNREDGPGAEAVLELPLE